MTKMKCTDTIEAIKESRLPVLDAAGVTHIRAIATGESGLISKASLASDVTDVTLGVLSEDDGASLVGYRWEENSQAIRRPVSDKLNDVVSVKDFGAIGDGAIDDTASFQAAFAQAAVTSASLHIPAGRYVINSPLYIADGACFDIDMANGAVLDFSSATLGTGAGIRVGSPSSSLQTLPGIPGVLTKGATAVAFGSAPSLAVGDLFVIWNDTDFSWSSDRNYYKAGEILRVSSVVGSTVNTDSALFAGYGAGVLTARRLITNTVRITGGKLLINGAANSIGIEMWNGYRSAVLGVDIVGAKNAQVAMRRCVESSVQLMSNDYSASVDLNYAVNMIACWKCQVQDSFIRSTRHAVTFTGGGIVASVPNRLCRAVDSYLEGELLAADMHGSCEWCSFDNCIIVGGVNIAGDYGYVNGGVVFSNPNVSNYTGVCVRVREPKGGNFGVIGARMVCRSAPTGNDAIIYMAQPASGAGGIMEVKDVTIVADVPVGRYVSMVNAGTVTDAVALVDGLTVQQTSGATGIIRLEGNASGGYERVSVRRVIGAAPRCTNMRVRSLVYDGVENTGSANNGVHASVLAWSGVVQHLVVRNCVVFGAQLEGIGVTGPSSSDAVHVVVSGNVSLNNGQDAGAAATSRVSIRVQDILSATLTDNIVGDTQAVPTQQYSVRLASIGTCVEANNQQIGSSLTKSNNITVTNGIPAL